MSQIELVEPAVLLLQSRLSANLNAAIDTINAAVTDGYTIDYPGQVLDYLPALSTLTVFPTVGIEHGAGIFEDDSGYSATGQYVIEVVPVIQDGDVQALVRKLRRYTLAVARVVLPNARNWGTGTALPWSVGLRRIDYGPALRKGAPDAEPPYQWVSFSAVQLTLKLDED